MRKITKLIIHCSDSDIAAHDDIEVIRKWHTLPKMPESVKKDIESGKLPKTEAFKYGRGFLDVGYHYFIKSNGHTQAGRKLSEVGAHCAGHNRDSIGVCLHGKRKFTEAQFAALRRLVADLKVLYSIQIFGHCDFDKGKTCPNFDYKSLNL